MTEDLYLAISRCGTALAAELLCRWLCIVESPETAAPRAGVFQLLALEALLRDIEAV